MEEHGLFFKEELCNLERLKKTKRKGGREGDRTWPLSEWLCLVLACWPHWAVNE